MRREAKKETENEEKKTKKKKRKFVQKFRMSSNQLCVTFRDKASVDLELQQWCNRLSNKLYFALWCQVL